jgi:hypothetical protein
MSDELLVSALKKVGWTGFAPGEFLGVDFEAIGKAKVARNNWFALVKPIPVLDAAGLEAWDRHYADFSKRSPARLFSAGKFFVLILLVDTVAADAVERLAQGEQLGFLKDTDEITGGGGYTMVVIKDRKQLLMPKKVRLWDAVRATDFLKQTHKAVVAYATNP